MIVCAAVYFWLADAAAASACAFDAVAASVSASDAAAASVSAADATAASDSVSVAAATSISVSDAAAASSPHLAHLQPLLHSKTLNGCNSTPAHEKKLSLHARSSVNVALPDGKAPGG